MRASVEPTKTLTCLNLCLKPKHLLEKDNLLISVYNVIWSLIGSMFYKNLRRVWVRRKLFKTNLSTVSALRNPSQLSSVMAFVITQTHKWKLLQLRPRSKVRSSTYRLYPHVLRLCVVLLRVLVIAMTKIRKTWTIFQKIYISLTTWWKKMQRRRKRNRATLKTFEVERDS